jgi:integrase
MPRSAPSPGLATRTAHARLARRTTPYSTALSPVYTLGTAAAAVALPVPGWLSTETLRLASGYNNCSVRQMTYTGARLGELTNALVEDFDAEHDMLYIRGGKTGERHTNLSKRAVAWFGRLVKGRDPGTQLLPDETCLYSLPHSYISLALLAGANHQLVAEKNCGMSLRMIEAHYGEFGRRSRMGAFSAL